MPAKSVRARYESALAPLGDVSLRWITPAGFSSVFAREALRHKREGRVLPGLVSAYPPSDNRAIATVSLVCFSAGYGLARELLRAESDRAALDGLVLLDALHTSTHGGDRNLEPFAAYAARAKAGRARFWSGHTDVPTYGYQSTTEANGRLLELSGGEGGGFLVRSYDTQPASKPKAEHGAALTDWGPAFVAETLCDWLPGRWPSQAPDTLTDPTDPEPVPWHDGLDLPSTPLGQRCVVWLGYQYGSEVREIPGPEHDPRILAYSEHCRRGGRFLGVTAGGTPVWDGGATLRLPTDDANSPWCAAMQSEALRCCLLPGETPPHGLRVSVRELVEDARLANTLRPAHWIPTIGSLAICGRAGQNPLHGGSGHVRGVVQVEAPRYFGIGGNEHDEVAMGWHELAAPEIKAWVER
jgi:hypothetical protein